MATTFDLEGYDAVIDKMRALPVEVRHKAGRSALRKAAQVIRDAAKRNAARINDPQTAEEISQNITERWGSRIYKRTGDLAFRVGVLGGARITKRSPKGSEPGGPGGDTRHWAYVEFGTERTAAQPFMTPAIEQNIQEVVTSFAINLDKGLDRAIKRGKS